MAEEDDSFRELLIEKVKSCRNLWDTTHKMHLNRKFTSNSWKLIARELQEYGKTADECKKCFTNFRTYYNRLRKIKSSGKEIHWPFYNLLEFLSESLETAGISSNIDLDINEEAFREHSPSVPCLETESFDSLASLGQIRSNIYAETTGPPVGDEEIKQNAATQTRCSRSFLMRKRSSTEIIGAKYMKSVDSLPHHSIEKPTEDHLDYFGKTIVGQLRNIHPDLQTETMFEIQRIMLQQDRRSKDLFSETCFLITE